MAENRVRFLGAAELAYREVGSTQRADLPKGYRVLRLRVSLPASVTFRSARDALVGWQLQCRAGVRLTASGPAVDVGVVADLRIGVGLLSVVAPCGVDFVVDEPEPADTLHRLGAAHPKLRGMKSTVAQSISTAAPDAGLFGPDSVAWRIHADPAMLVGGIRALMLQAVHPLVMAGFNDNSFFRSDPWGRLQRTGQWLATVTYGTTEDAAAAGARLRNLHARLAPGVEPESGLHYRVDDPHLLAWVHCTEVESFLSTYSRSGGYLARGDGDRYVAEMRASGELVGLSRSELPATEADIADYYRTVRPELRVTKVARRNVLWGFAPPMPRWVELATPARPAWAALVAVAAGMLPPWARRLYRLPGFRSTDITATLAGRAIRRTALALPPALAQSPASRSARARMAAG